MQALRRTAASAPPQRHTREAKVRRRLGAALRACHAMPCPLCGQEANEQRRRSTAGGSSMGTHRSMPVCRIGGSTGVVSSGQSTPLLRTSCASQAGTPRCSQHLGVRARAPVTEGEEPTGPSTRPRLTGQDVCPPQRSAWLGAGTAFCHVGGLGHAGKVAHLEGKQRRNSSSAEQHPPIGRE